MFFGLEVKSNVNQAKPLTLGKTLKLSQAVLEPGKGTKKEPVSLVVEYEKKQFILCVLDPNLAWQSPLDLVFEGGSQVKFFVRGSGTVHLTGYECLDDDLDEMSVSMSSDEEVDITDSEEEPQNIKVSKGSAKKSPKGKANGMKGPNKAAESRKETNSDEDDSEDSDFNAEDGSDDDDDDDDEEIEDMDEDMSDGSLDGLEDSDDE